MTRIEEGNEPAFGARLVCSELGKSCQDAVAYVGELRAGMETAIAVEAEISPKGWVVSRTVQLAYFHRPDDAA